MSSPFIFELGQPVRIRCSGEAGHVIGRTEYLDTHPHNYYVRFKSSTGRACEEWWTAAALEPDVSAAPAV
jgi:hypothetical protein